MFKVKDTLVLEELKFQKYKLGYSKKIAVDNYDFIDFDAKNLILKKVKFIESEFVYEDLTYEDLCLVIKKTLNLETDKIKEYIERNFERIGI